MSAEENNKYAETLTRDVALDLARKALDLINDGCYLISDVAEKCGTYRTKFNYLLTKFNEDEEVKDTLERLYNKCESILARLAITNKINPIVSIFILKSYHGLMEVTKTQHEIEVGDLSNLYKKAMSSNEKEPGRESD